MIFLPLNGHYERTSTMIIEQIGTGASTAEAFENAKALLGAPEDAEIHNEILQEAKKKLFGLKTEPAKVRVWYEKEDPKPAPAPKSTPAPKSAPVKQPKTEKTAQNNNNNGAKPAEKEQKAPQQNQKKKNEQTKKEVPAKKEAPKKAEETAPEAAAEEALQEQLTELPIDENDAAVKFLRMILKGMNIENCELTLKKNENNGEFIYNLSSGSDDGAIIGRRGETLDAVQYLLRLTENKGVEEAKHRKLTVNVGDYREKRTQSLRLYAQKSAKQALKYGRNVALEPMPAYERRIIHTTIQGIEGVTSHSVGSDSNRKVIISLEEGVTPTNPSRGYNNRSRSGGGRRDGGYQKREPYKPSVTREPRKDNAGALYGKIEIPEKKDEE